MLVSIYVWYRYLYKEQEREINSCLRIEAYTTTSDVVRYTLRSIKTSGKIITQPASGRYVPFVIPELSDFDTVPRRLREDDFPFPRPSRRC